jgi:hypothetical protein
MRVALALAAGVAVGLALAFRIRPTSKESCCVRVAQGVRDRVGEKCGPVCQSIGDALGIWPSAPDILDQWGL